MATATETADPNGTVYDAGIADDEPRFLLAAPIDAPPSLTASPATRSSSWTNSRRVPINNQRSMDGTSRSNDRTSAAVPASPGDAA